MNVEAVRLETLAAEGRYSLIGGPFGSKLTSKDYVAEGIPVIRGSNMNGGRYLDETDFVFVSEQKMREDLFGNLAYPGDIVFTQRGTLGQVALIPSESNFDTYVISQSQMKLTVDSKKADPRFIYYYFSSSEAQQRILNQNSSSGVPHINLTALRNFPVPKLPVSTQAAIADILSAYDDLIENNRRRIALLEEAARLLYREWFVHLRFPGHEHTPLTNGLPEGWENTKASSLVDVLSGGTPRTGNPAYWDGDIGFFTPKDATDTPFVLSTEKTLTEDGLKSCNSRLYPEDTLFITARGTVGKLNLALVPMAMNQSCYALRSKSHLGQRHLYVALKAAVEQVRAHATGAVFDAIVVATFDRIPLLLPAEAISRQFEDIINPMFDQIANLHQQNQKLAEARDLLLPRLMNGEIAV